MSMIRQAKTGLPVGDPDRLPLSVPHTLPTRQQLDAALASMILSPSGWRTVFAAEGGDEGRSATIRPAHEVIAAIAGRCFAQLLQESNGAAQPVVLLGMDTRPTGPALADIFARALLASGCAVRHIHAVAAPEIMAYARACGQADGELHADGFIYISASHNPIGHNGLKFGRVDGGVLTAGEAKLLIARFREAIAAPDSIAEAARLVAAADRTELARIYERCALEKRAAYSAYLLFTREVVTGEREADAQDRLFDRLEAELARRPLGILADFNGSARSIALDRDLLEGLGIRFAAINDAPGAIAHRIVPEGVSLDSCRIELERLHAEKNEFVMGYLPDCDGDRGNVVIWDEKLRAGRSLGAQEVFSLCCVAELAQLVWNGQLSYNADNTARERVAVAVNDPTSLRVDAIARAFGAATFRAEVGEANVVGLARSLREKGWTIRILGEGAAGGNITHPSAVRDPIDTIFALLKLLALRSQDGKPGLFEIWCRRSGQPEAYREDFTLTDIIESLPKYTSTGSYEAQALLKIQTENHTLLKDRYEPIFRAEWEARKADFGARLGFASWEALAYNGQEEKPIVHSFGEAGKGGLKVRFLDESGKERAYIWMRGSGTEPVFRVMAEVEGDRPETERELLDWQRAMIMRADAMHHD